MTSKVERFWIRAELPRELTPRERGALWLVALKIQQIINSSGFGDIRINIHNGRVDMVEGLERTKEIPEIL